MSEGERDLLKVMGRLNLFAITHSANLSEDEDIGAWLNAFDFAALIDKKSDHDGSTDASQQVAHP